MNKFEKNIKDAVEGYEAPYSADAWQSLNKAMGPSRATLIKWAASSAALIALVVLGYTYFDNTTLLEDEKLVIETVKDQTPVKLAETVKHSNTNQHNLLVSETEKETFDVSQPSTPEVIIEDQTKEANSTTTTEETDTKQKDKITSNESKGTEIKENQPDQVNTIAKFNSAISSEGTIQCLSNTFTFRPIDINQNVIFEWNLGDGTIINSKVVDHKYDQAGNYLVELTLRHLRTKEVIQTSSALEVTVMEEPSTSFIQEHSMTIEPSTYFKNTTPNINSLQWEIENLKSSNLESFNYSFKHKGDYIVHLTATNEQGCSATTTQTVRIEQDYNLLAPTAFSPNGDNLNDDFMPKALPLMELPFTLTIYDRQGKLVYQTTDSSQPWDGQYTQDAIPAPNGVYVWVCQLTKENGETEIYQSQVVIAK